MTYFRISVIITYLFFITKQQIVWLKPDSCTENSEQKFLKICKTNCIFFNLIKIIDIIFNAITMWKEDIICHQVS